MTSRKKKILSIQILILFLASSLIYFTYYNHEKLESEMIKKIPNKTSADSGDSSNLTNTFEDIEYKGIDLNGNRYIIKSEDANFEISQPELINMRIMQAIFYFKDGKVLTVYGDYGTYNNITKDMEFRDNIEAIYEKNYLYADNLDYYNSKSSLRIYGNVSTESIQGNIMADKLDFDLSLQTLDISMFDKDQVNVKLRN